ncbi:hypothetical protein BDW59DRAFT_164327 [Aspergillus cavernicola]|uniref:Major facilitator superfamily (MFS) profile domain-containing protein n=1 Tax=Aspergillus cavernicola TaxID=176166 RepID=A0ABR4I0P2_9EURO
MLAKYHAEGNESDPLVQFEYNEIRRTIAHDQAHDQGNVLSKYWEFARTPGNRKRFFILAWCACLSQMSGNAFISYYLSPILAQMLFWFSALCFASLPAKSSAGIAVVVFIYLFSPAYNLGLNSNLGLYITEIVPYTLRLRGMAVFQFWNLGFSLFSTFAVPVGLDALGWKLYCIFVAWVVVEGVVVWCTFPETKGPTLEEIAVVFDGPRAANEKA